MEFESVKRDRGTVKSLSTVMDPRWTGRRGALLPRPPAERKIAMRSRCRFLFLPGLLFLASTALGAAGEETETQITLYRDSLALVREIRTLSLARGIQPYRLTGIPARVDPSSVFLQPLSGPGAWRVVEQSFVFDVADTDRLLARAKGGRILVTDKQGQTHSGTLVSALSGDLLLKEADESLKIVKADSVSAIQVFSPTEGLVTEPALVWILEAEKSGSHRAALSYLAEGIRWEADYLAVAEKGDETLSLSGWATIENRSGVSYRDCRIGLVAGEVHRARAGYGSPEMRVMEAMAAAPKEAPAFEEAPFAEYHLYKLSRKADLPDGEMKQLSLCGPVTVKAKKAYRYEGQRHASRVETTLEFENREGEGPGVPLPGGRVRVYEKDETGSLRLLGEDRIEHTPKGERVRVALGTAFDLVGERTVKESTKISGNARKETIEIRIRNQKQESVKVLVAESFWGDWQILGKTPPIFKKDARKVEFEIAVPAGGESAFEYQVLLR